MCVRQCVWQLCKPKEFGSILAFLDFFQLIDNSKAVMLKSRAKDSNSDTTTAHARPVYFGLMSINNFFWKCLERKMTMKKRTYRIIMVTFFFFDKTSH